MLLPPRVELALAGVVARYSILDAHLGVTRLDLQIRHLPADLDGFCIAHISDLHVGEGKWEPRRASEAAEVVQTAVPDIVINTGDFVRLEPPLDKVMSVVVPFVAPGAANLSILGNHDYHAGTAMVASLTRRLEGAGIEVLRNAVFSVKKAGAIVSVVGLTQEEPGFGNALTTVSSTDGPRIALVHQPDLAERLPLRSVQLILAGHTHGGQVSLPGLKPIVIRQFSLSRYTDGLHDVGGTPMYVNRGLGCTGLPVRFGSSPEVTLIRLVR